MKSIDKLTVKFFGFFLALAIVVPLHAVGQADESKSIRLNPEFKINRNSNGTVTVTSRNPHENVKHEFDSFYADLLMGAFRKQSIDNITDSLRKKYYLSEDECRRELKRAINTLAEWKIILRDNDLALH